MTAYMYIEEGLILNNVKEIITMALYEVTATFKGKRIRTEMNFTSKAQAIMYAEATNKNYPGARARVVKGGKKK